MVVVCEWGVPISFGGLWNFYWFTLHETNISPPVLIRSPAAPASTFKKPIFATQKLKVSWLDDRIPSPKYGPLFFCGGVGFWWNPWKSLPWKNCTQIPLEKWGWRFSGVLFFGGKFWPCFRGRDVRFLGMRKPFHSLPRWWNINEWFRYFSILKP